ncbi:hypothetical protein B7486_58325 [cyanobacterium TDX16]|nr:hypothetical protein B7486_58325 [cyanobacterium TDX16]
MRAEEEVAVANRQLALKQAEIKSETDAAAAEAAASGPLAKAARDEEVIAAQEKVAERQALLKERELDTSVRKPADAERYAVEVKAEGEKSATIRRAEASREATIASAEAKAEENRLVGAGERQRREELAKAEQIEGAATGAAEQARREAIAAAVRAEGSAEADATLAKGEAEAQAMEKKAQAYEQYGEAAIVDLLARVLPDVVREASAPLANVDNMTVISTEGATDLTKTVAGNVAQGMQLASDLVGIDVAALFANLAQKRGTGDAAGNGSSTPAAVGAGSSSASAADATAGDDGSAS